MKEMKDGIEVGQFLRGEHFSHGYQLEGVALFEDDDSSIAIIGYSQDGEQFGIEYIRTPNYTPSPAPVEHLHECPEQLLPLFRTNPKYVFVVIRPGKRKIDTYANLDALMEGLTNGDGPPDREDAIREAVAEAIADPGTDFRYASNSPWIRFQQVEGA